MKVIAVLAMIVLLPGAAMAQSPAATNSIYLELAGNGLFYSVNYDHLFTESFGGRVGVGLVVFAFGGMGSLPLTAYRVIGSGNNKLELGLGVCLITQPDTQSFSSGASSDDEFKGNGVLGTANVGYRYQRAEGGFVFRAGLTPFFGKFVHVTERYEPEWGYDEEDVFRFNFWGGISFGYAF